MIYFRKVHDAKANINPFFEYLDNNQFRWTFVLDTVSNYGLAIEMTAVSQRRFQSQDFLEEF